MVDAAQPGSAGVGRQEPIQLLLRPGSVEKERLGLPAHPLPNLGGLHIWEPGDRAAPLEAQLKHGQAAARQSKPGGGFHPAIDNWAHRRSIHCPGRPADRRGNGGGRVQLTVGEVQHSEAKKRKLGLVQPSGDQSGPAAREATATSDSDRENGGRESRQAPSSECRLKAGGGIPAAIERARNPGWLRRVRSAYLGRMFTPATVAAKNSRRKRVAEILEAVVATPFPLSCESLTMLGTVLFDADIQSAAIYLHEAKLMHVELGHCWNDQLDAKFKNCKRALQRKTGPEKRASEFKPEDIPAGIWEAKSRTASSLARPAWSYAWATVWMLRAAEAAKVRAGDVTLCENSRSVVLHIRMSKTDQQARGVKRTLQCCRKTPCGRLCPYSLAERSLGEAKVNRPTAPLFPSGSGNWVAQTDMVKAWSGTLAPAVTGHSARRSGAMRYTRQGMAVSDISFLGRWKSAAVYRYIEEALQEIPLNARCTQVSCESREEPSILGPVTIPCGEKEGAATAQKLPGGEAMVQEGMGEKEKLWVVSRHRRTCTTHVVGQAAWNIKIEQWSTLCGWNFARKNVNAQVTKWAPENSKLCQKCRDIEATRDGVTSARELAGAMKWPVMPRK